MLGSEARLCFQPSLSVFSRRSLKSMLSEDFFSLKFVRHRFALSFFHYATPWNSPHDSCKRSIDQLQHCDSKNDQYAADELQRR